MVRVVPCAFAMIRSKRLAKLAKTNSKVDGHLLDPGEPFALEFLAHLFRGPDLCTVSNQSGFPIESSSGLMRTIGPVCSSLAVFQFDLHMMTDHIACEVYQYDKLLVQGMASK